MKIRTIVDHGTHHLTLELIPETTVDRDQLALAGTQTEAKIKKNGTLTITIEMTKQTIGRSEATTRPGLGASIIEEDNIGEGGAT